MDTPRRPDSVFRSIIWWITLFFIAAFCLFGICKLAGATVVNGTLTQGGQPLTGYVDINLIYPGSTGSGLALPSSCPGSPTCHMPVYNGKFTPFTTEGNDTLLPRGTYYQVTYYDAYNAPIARMPYVITGATFDLGAAVPTPVTTSNINFLDLLGLRSLSVNFLTVNQSIQIGAHGATFSQAGITGAQRFNDTRWTSGYLTGSTTCGIQEAIASLTSAGGTIYLANGSCTLTTAVSITTPIHIVGMGMDSTTLVNGTGTQLIVVSPVGAATLSGVSLSDFTIAGAGGLNNIQVAGASGVVQQMVVDRVRSQGGNFGLTTGGLVSSLSITRSIMSGNQIGIGLTGGASGTVISTTDTGQNVGDGIQISGSVGGVSVIDSNSSNSTTGNGLQVVAGDAAATVHIARCQFTNNGNAGVIFADGFGHTVDSSQFFVGTHQRYGVYIATPTLGDTFTTQVTLKDNYLANALTADVATTSTPSYVLIYPQSEQVGSGLVHYSFADPTKVHFISPAGPSFPSRVCNGNGCYIQFPDGSIMAWGVATGCTTAGAGDCTAGITFPIAFTTTANLAVQTTCITTSTNCTMSYSSVTTSGFTAEIAATVRVGGSGSNLSSQVSWSAKGN